MSGSLLAARVRHHAIRAELVAALDDGDVAAMLVRARGELGVERLVGLAIVQPGDALSRRPPAAPASPAGSDRTLNQTPANIRSTLEDLLAFLLGHATEHAEALALPCSSCIRSADERPSAPLCRGWNRCCKG